MLEFLVKRIAWTAVLFLCLTMMTFVIFFVIPTEEIRVGRGQSATQADIRDELRLNGPVYSQYTDFVWGIVRHGSFGQSLQNRREVRDIIAETAPVTASLVFGGVILWMLIAMPIGVMCALRPRSLLDKAATVFVLLGICAHPVWIGFALSYVLGYKLALFPTGGYCDLFTPSTDCGGPAEWFRHMILPWIAFAFLFAALYTRMIRAKVLESLGEDYVRTAQAKGASVWRVLRAHVLRLSMLPIVTMIGMDAAIALGGSVFIEQVFGLPGLGRTALQSLNRRDLPVIMGVVVFMTTAVAVFNLIVDLLYAWIDPRIRIKASRTEGEGSAAPRREVPAPALQPTK